MSSVLYRLGGLDPRNECCGSLMLGMRVKSALIQCELRANQSAATCLMGGKLCQQLYSFIRVKNKCFSQGKGETAWSGNRGDTSIYVKNRPLISSTYQCVRWLGNKVKMFSSNQNKFLFFFFFIDHKFRFYNQHLCTEFLTCTNVHKWPAWLQTNRDCHDHTCIVWFIPAQDAFYMPCTVVCCFQNAHFHQ